MKRSTRILAIVGGITALLLLALALLPLLFRDRIEQRVKAEVNRSVAARVDWRDLGLTFFRNFPNLTLRLDDLTVAGTGRFEGDTLAAIRHLRVVLDVASVVGSVLGGGGPIVVRSVALDQPRLRLIALEDGTANWDIMRDTARAEPAAAAADPMAVSLRRFEISDAAVSFVNRQAGLEAGLVGFHQSLEGDLSRDNVTIRTRARSEETNLTFAGVPYLNRVRLGIDADVQADLARKLFRLESGEVRLNDLRLNLAGSASAGGEDIGLDLAFKAPGTDFRHILSLVPAIYARDFESVQTAGTVAVAGQVKGSYGDSAFPSFALRAKVDNASFRYPDLPLPARDIFVDLAITNPGGDADSTVVRLTRFHVRVGRDPVDAKLVLRTPISDPDVDLRVTGKLDLADVRRTMKLEGIDELAGTVAADAAVRTRMSYIDKQQYDRVAASGSVNVANLTVKGADLPQPLAIREAALRLAPHKAELTSFSGTVGSSDLRATGALENLLGFAFRDDVLRGTATVRSNRFNLDEWRSGEGDLEIIPVPANLDFSLDAAVAELTYDKLKLSNARGRLRIKDRRVTLDDFRMNTLGGTIGVNGYYETIDTTRPTFDAGLQMTTIDIPAAFEAFTTVKLLAPVARYASGNFTTDLRVNGALGKDMTPLFKALSGRGTLQTTQLALKDFPALEKLVDLTKLQLLDDPALKSIRTAFQIRDGRLHVEPFAVQVGPTTMNVAGSNGLDQSLRYDLRLQVPRSELGGAANEAVAGVVSRLAGAGIDLKTAPAVELGIKLTGTVTDPAVKIDAASAVSSAKEGVEQAVREGVEQKVSAEATRLVAEAEERAAVIRQEAQALADKVKAEGYQQADALLQRASNPLLRAAAKPAADKLRSESDEKAAGIVREADQRASSLVAEARQRANQPAQ